MGRSISGRMRQIHTSVRLTEWYIFLLQLLVICFMLLANRRSCNLVSKDNFPERDCKSELVGFRYLEKLGSKYIKFLFREPGCNPVRELMISRPKMDYWLLFLAMEVRRQDKDDILPIRNLIWLLVFSILFARNMLKISVWLMFGFVICFYVCILLLVNCVDLFHVQCIYFMTYFRRLCFATVSGVL